MEQRGSTMTCECRPGSYKTGWHEMRCVKCVQAEKAIWHEMLERWETEGGRHVLGA